MDNNEEFKKFLSMLAAMNAKKEEEQMGVAHKLIAKIYMEQFLEFQRVGFSADQSFELLKLTIKDVLHK